MILHSNGSSASTLCSKELLSVFYPDRSLHNKSLKPPKLNTEVLRSVGKCLSVNKA